MKKLIALTSIFLLVSGCGEDESGFLIPDRRSADLVYSYPYDGQQEVSPKAPIVLRFSDTLTLEDEAAVQAAVSLASADQPAVSLDYSVRFVDDGRGLVIDPAEPLAVGAAFQVTFDGVSTSRGDVRLPGDGQIEFSTRAALEGSRAARIVDDSFVITRRIPDGDAYPVMDFSSYRLTFSQPIDRQTVRYGDGMDDTLVLRDALGEVVEATVLVKGRSLTVDPVADLQADDSYTLSLNSGIASIYGDAFAGAEFALAPKASAPRETLVQRVGDSAGGTILSPLTGQPINSVPVTATLLGNDTSSQQQGDAFAELAFVPNYPVVSPLVIRRGQLLEGSDVELLVAGVVPAGVNSGTLSVTFISDAVGFLLPNQYSAREDSPRHVRLFMDVAMTAEDSRANGGLSQDILHVEVAGTAIVRNGLLEINAVGVVEPELLGVENAFGVLSFAMQAYADQLAAPQSPVDLDGPMLQSWVPGNEAEGNVAKQSPDNPVILNFSEPLDPASVVLPGAISVTRDGMVLGNDVLSWYLDGSAVVMQFAGGLQFNSDYVITLSPLLTDIAGNGLATGSALPADYRLTLRLPDYIDDEGSDADDRAPIAIAVYPGFPCVTEGRDLANGDHGQCAGGLATDDHLPVTALPQGRPIRVAFSQTIDPSTVVLGSSFRVEQDVEGVWQTVPGLLSVGPRSLRFMPSEPWVSDDGATLYRYVLGSQGADGSDAVNCGVSSICDERGLPLQTQVLAQLPDDAPGPLDGGPDMDIYFVGGDAVTSVYQPARNLPALDVNANSIYDGRTTADYVPGGADLAAQYPVCASDPTACEDLPEADGEGGYLTPPNASQLLVVGVGDNAVIQDANVGCSFDGSNRLDCPERKFINLTGALNAELRGAVIYEGPDSPAGGEQAVHVDIYPTLLTTTNLDVYARTNLGGDPIYTPSGQQILRARYACDADADPSCADGSDTSDLNDRSRLIPGYILDRCEDREVVDDQVTGSTGCPVFRITFDLYLDAPSLAPEILGVPLAHSVHSLARSVTLEGPVNTLADGRLEIAQVNAQPIDLDLVVTGTLPLPVLGELLPVDTFVSEEINVQIPPGGVFLNYITEPAKP